MGKTVEVDNPAGILLYEDGVFEVIDPAGTVFEVTCRRGSKMSFRAISDSKHNRRSDAMKWRIRRLPWDRTNPPADTLARRKPNRSIPSWATF
jgi:hypothetical protein